MKQVLKQCLIQIFCVLFSLDPFQTYAWCCKAMKEEPATVYYYFDILINMLLCPL